MPKNRYIALYLPQFHPVDVNDKYWGKGFTEWTNTVKAKPLFRGHYQPHIPADLGFYDLRMEECRIAQAELAKAYGIEGFCYWYYWFGRGETLLEMPIANVLESGKPDFPFAIAWANHSWTTSTWINNKKTAQLIKEQRYLGREDYERFFYHVLPLLQDKRYIRIDGRPMFMVHNPLDVPDTEIFIETWRTLANKNGIGNMFFIASSPGIRYNRVMEGKKIHTIPSLNDTETLYSELLAMGYDAINSQNIDRAELSIEGRLQYLIKFGLQHKTNIPILNKYSQEKLNKYILSEFDKQENVFPSLFNNWDRSPRAGKKALIITESTPKVFARLLKQASDIIKDKPFDKRIVFLRSWNEWGEGNHLEPDLKYGLGYLEAIKAELER